MTGKSHIAYRVLEFIASLISETFKDEAQIALFKEPSSYRAVNTIHLGYKNQPVVLYGAEVAVCSQINTKHINAVWTQRTTVEC
jgi:hypothetical protein